MKNLVSFILFISISVLLIDELKAQEPYDIPCVDFKTYKAPDFTSILESYTTKEVGSYSIQNFQPLSKQNLGFSGSIFESKLSLIPNINVSLIQYRLGIFSYVAKKVNKRQEKGDTVRVYLPFLIMSKFNTNYDSANVAEVSDITGFNGSPLTLRLMPSYAFNIGIDNVLTIGHSSDFRLLITKDSTFQKIQTDYGYYGTFGIKYAGRGDVRDESGITNEGKWSLSALLYGFIGNKNTLNQVFGSQDKFASGIETIFKFNVIDRKVTRFNIYISAKYQLNKVENSNPFIFNITFGN